MSGFRILVVDDEPAMLRSVERVLGQDYKLAATQHPREALRLAQAFKPDLAILDVQMPDLDGFELMEKLQAIDSELDIILMTGSVYEIDAKLIWAIRKRAFYFLQKPFDREVLLTLVERCLELKRLNRENRKHLQRIERELAEARAFQQSLLPPRQGKMGGISIFAHYAPCFELAGDIYDYAGFAQDHCTLLVADVSGHGASAAMLTGIVKSNFHSASREGYEPASVVERVSNGIQTCAHHHFITLICIRIQGGRLEYVNAGHPPGILLGLETSPVLLHATGGLISPAFPDFSWEQHTIEIQGKNRIVLFTDGIVEAESESGEYGLQRLIEHASRPSVAGDVLADQIVRSVRQFTGGRRVQDDLTLVVADL